MAKKEIQRQHVLSELRKLGIVEIRGVSIELLDYEVIRSALVVKRAVESQEGLISWLIILFVQVT